MAAASHASGLWTSPLELATSLDPKDYLYPTPTAQQAEALAQQARLLAQPGIVQPGRLEASHPAASAPGGGQLPCQGGNERAPLVSVLDDLNTHLTLDLDDDCLRLIMVEEGDESKPEPSSGASASTCTGAGGGAGKELADSCPVAPAAADAAAAGSAKAGPAPEEEEDLLLEAAPSLRHDDPAVELGPTRDRAHSAAPSVSKCESEGTTLSGLADHEGPEQQGGCAGSPLKRGRSEAPGAGFGPTPEAKGLAGKPSAFAGLMLSMDYHRAVESINLQLTCGTDASLPEELLSLSPLAGMKTPEGPDLLSPGSDLLPTTASKWGLAVAEESASAKRQRR